MLLYNYRIRKSKLEAWVTAFGESAQGTDPYIAYQTSKYYSLRSAQLFINIRFNCLK